MAWRRGCGAGAEVRRLAGAQGARRAAGAPDQAAGASSLLAFPSTTTCSPTLQAGWDQMSLALCSSPRTSICTQAQGWLVMSSSQTSVYSVLGPPHPPSTSRCEGLSQIWLCPYLHRYLL